MTPAAVEKNFWICWLLMNVFEHPKLSKLLRLHSLSVKVIGLLREHERLTISEIVKHSGANQHTLKVRLRELVSAGHIPHA